MGDMELDSEFEAFDLQNDDLALIEQTEQIYLDTQQTRRSPSPSDKGATRNRSTRSTNVTHDDQNILFDLSPEAEEGVRPPLNQSSWNPTVPNARPSHEEEVLNDVSSSIRHDTQRAPSGISPEAERIIEGLRFQIERLRLNTASTNDREQREALILLQEKVKDKERDIIQLKKELYKYKEQSSDSQQKRSFPGVNVFDKPKNRRVLSRPSPFTQSISSFSVPASRASTPRYQASQTPTPIDNIPKETSMPTLASLASSAMPLVPPAPGNIPNRSRTVSVKMEEASQSTPPVTKEVTLEDVPSSIVKKPTHLSQPPRLKKPIRKMTETESNKTLLNVLFEPLFQRWNMKRHNNTKDMNTSLTQDLVKEFSEQFAQQFVPELSSCPSEDYERLQLLASDISSYLIKSESANVTIHLLLNIFSLSLKICIKDELYTVIYNIVHVIHLLAEKFPVTRSHLYKEIAFDTGSLLYQLTKSLSLFPFYEQHCKQLLSEYPEVADMKLEAISRITSSYRVKPSELIQDLSAKKSTNEDINIVKTILELFNCVAYEYKGQLFAFLLTENDFLNLLHPKRPYDMIMLTLTILEASLTDPQSMSDYNDPSLQLLNYVTNLVIAPQSSLSLRNWYELRIKSINLLHQIVISETPESLATKINQIILTKTKEAMDMVTSRLGDDQEYAKSNTIGALRDEFLEAGCETMYFCINNCPNDIFSSMDEPSITSVSDMVNFFQCNVQPDHPMTSVILQFRTLLDIRLKKPTRMKKRTNL